MATGAPRSHASEVISSFTGKYRFLSNFYQCEIRFDGNTYPSSEHAYMAARTHDVELKERFQNPTELSAGQAKRLGRSLVLRDDWEEVKDQVMFDILCAKFSKSDLRELLDSTGSAILIEGNTWGDVYWGECPIGTGRNQLGITLMSIRDHTMWQLL